MKGTLVTLAVVLFLGLFCFSQTQPVPANIRHAQELQVGNERDFARPPVDPVVLRQEADQLAALAGSIPPDVQKVNKGLLSKDLIQKLKKIEKLSKHLRSELDR
ncbi:MAG TPA: hypothetical protein VJQ59_06450 [Candidatus Sulfotelmatobacter sp.]|nr:hypothetical protein [Candidatus Sulfotelmatobacter sp.]